MSNGGATTGTSTASGCPGTGGPSMVKLPQGYCIDSTEVTRSQYAAWLSTISANAINTQDSTNCSWNTTFTPDATCMASSDVCQGTACGNHPQACVDWCDAYVYCKGVGKRLCGAIAGGQVAFASYADSTTSQWYSACSSAGTFAYPYGNTRSTTICNGPDYWAANATLTTTSVGSLTGCQAPSPYDGVYDLSGNVDEWEDSCDGTGRTSLCRIRGGAFAMSGLACGDQAEATRGLASGVVGFRCCAP